VHRLLLLGATSLLALALSGPAAAWSWPADGDVLRPFTLGSNAYAAGQHRGIDVAGPEGSSIRAPASGTVSFAGSLPTHGRSLTILTSDGYAVTLVHLGSIEVGKGDAVTEGSAVATMGSSGEPEHAVDEGEDPGPARADGPRTKPGRHGPDDEQLEHDVDLSRGESADPHTTPRPS